jgi:hypothetical protein
VDVQLILGSLVGDIHVGWAWVVIIGNGLAGVWALGAHKIEGLRTKALWWYTTFVQLAITVQVVLGISAQRAEGIDVQPFHMFYGFVGMITVGLLFSYRHQLAHRVYLLYGFGGLFLMGLGIRAMLKAPVA